MDELVTVQLRVSEVNALIQLMGETKSSTGFYPLMKNIESQAHAFINNKKPAPPATTNPTAPTETLTNPPGDE